MIDSTLLKSVGWNEQLIVEAKKIAGSLDDFSAFPVIKTELDFSILGQDISFSESIDASGPPVAHSKIAIPIITCLHE